MPFSTEEFLQVFEQYNRAVWPMQLILFLLGALAVIFLFRKKSKNRMVVNGVLGFFWAWMGVVYHWIHLTEINPAAYIFGGFFVLQGVLFLWSGFYRKGPAYGFQMDLKGIMGMLLLFYAMVAYPFLAYFFGHTFPQSPTFGLPCPTTIFTFGILLFSVERPAWYLFSIPFLWSLIGFSAAVNLSIKEDWGLVLAGLIAVLFFLFYKYPRGSANEQGIIYEIYPKSDNQDYIPGA